MTNCTVVITTRNRPEYLKRILDYYKANGAGLEFIIIDCSSAEDQVSNQKTVDFYNNQEGVKFTRHSYAGSTDPWVKFADGMSKVKTEYCVLCAEDDFIVPRAIKASVEFLENNPDFSMAHGKYISFRVQDRNLPSKKFCWGNMYPHKSIVSDDPKIRLSEHFVNYNPTMYAVHSTPLLLMVFSENIKAGVDLALFGELMPSLLSLIYSKMKVLDIFYCARQEDSSYVVSHGIKRPSMTDYIQKGTFWPEYEKFKKYLVNRLVEISGIDETEAAQTIDGAAEKYIQTSYPQVFDYYRFEIAAQLANFFKKIHSPRFIYRSLSFVYRLFFPISKNKPDHDFSGTALAYCQKDLDAVRDKVISYGNL